MSDPADDPQIGDLDVPQEVIDQVGAPLDAVLSDLGALSAHPHDDDLPGSGWRLLKRWETGVAVVGAPVDDSRRSWRVAHVDPRPAGAPPRSVRVNSETWAVRPSRAERSRGLELRWPTATTDFVEEALEGVGFCIDIVNTADARWRPDGDPFRVVGVLAPTGQTDFAFGWMSGGGQNRAVPLGPGEYARVPVVIGPEQWRQLEPGDYELHAILPGLAVRAASPLALRLTADVLDRQRERVRAPQRSRAEERDQLEMQILQARAQSAGRPRLAEVARAAAAAVTREAARDDVQRILECNVFVADAVLNTRLVDFTDEGVEQSERLIEHLEERKAQL